ncbi:MAG TPA: type II CAAX endopeptidase family protein [Puia sp.]|nr:type II CAAX endopeptidase family protein [Puia sp.]
MPDPITKSPMIARPWLRIVLFGIAFCIIALLLGVPAILYLTGTPIADLEHDAFGTLSKLMAGNYLWLMLLLEFIVSVLTVAIFRLVIERRGWTGLGWDLDGFASEALTGLFLGPAILGLAASAILLSGHLQWVDIVWQPTALFISLGWMILISFSEELVFRGYLLGNLMEALPNKWIALAISSFLFALYHAVTPGIHTLAFANLFLAGMLLGTNYLFTKNLWFSFLLHLGWNFFEGPIMGFKVSGTTFPSLLQAEPNGDLFITGGDYGLEGSILMTLLLLTALFVMYWAWERKYSRVTPPASGVAAVSGATSIPAVSPPSSSGSSKA